MKKIFVLFILLTVGLAVFAQNSFCEKGTTITNYSGWASMSSLPQRMQLGASYSIDAFVFKSPVTRRRNKFDGTYTYAFTGTIDAYMQVIDTSGARMIRPVRNLYIVNPPPNSWESSVFGTQGGFWVADPTDPNGWEFEVYCTPVVISVAIDTRTGTTKSYADFNKIN